MAIKIINEYEETDKSGVHLVKEQSNGIKVRLLKEPSEWYKDKKAANNAKEKIKSDAQAKKDKAKRLIEDRVKENAKAELISEGILDKNGELPE